LFNFLAMRKRPAFTLIEILVVVAIVAMLAVVAIANFGTVRQSVKMDYTADALVDLINLQQNKARSGRQETDSAGTGEPLCYGVGFSMDKPYVQVIQAQYVSVDMNIDPTNADFCNMQNSTAAPFEQFEDNKLTGIEKFGIAANEMTIMFRPPEARISFGSENASFTNDPKVTVTFSSANGKETRSFTVDAASGLAERVGTGSRVRPRMPGLTRPPVVRPSLRQVSPANMNNTLFNVLND
jgi:prepilin-type N-terminal cleavage/methylation domain-containing protein